MFSETSSPALRLTESPIQKASQAISSGGKSDTSPLSIADVRYEWSYASTPIYLHVVNMNKFKCTFNFPSSFLPFSVIHSLFHASTIFPFPMVSLT